MAETPKKTNIRVIGIYIIIILALLRFLVYPLQASLQEKKVLLGERYESYRLKYQVQERQQRDQGEKTIGEKEVFLLHFYEKGFHYSYIQSDILERIIKLAEKKGMTVLNFEMLEPVAGKGISEVPILVRLKGPSGALIETLESIEKSEKMLSIRSMEITRSGQDHAYSLTISAFRIEI